ncbi:ester cyclase [Sinomonas mesophila]|uniref:ester cyclase n=1 Tax=Sinomonas mesophila TaxID=1531955 RepID=UPI000986E8EF|nr:ester cyclase [Sinomonas mesophila]
MTADDVRRTDDEGMAAWDAHDPDRFVALLGEGFQFKDTSLPEPLTTADQVKEYMRSWFTAFPDMRVATTNRVISDDSVAAEVEFTGTQTGPLNAGGQEIPPTGKAVRSTGTYFARVEDGKISSFSAHPDSMGLMAQLGLMG